VDRSPVRRLLLAKRHDDEGTAGRYHRLVSVWALKCADRGTRDYNLVRTGRSEIRSLEGLAGGLGFEPRLAESESAVLPLDDPPPGSPRLHSTAAAHLNSWSAARYLQDPRPSPWSRSLLWVKVRETAHWRSAWTASRQRRPMSE